jgi:hypothetical protein
MNISDLPLSEVERDSLLDKLSELRLNEMNNLNCTYARTEFVDFNSECVLVELTSGNSKEEFINELVYIELDTLNVC